MTHASLCSGMDASALSASWMGWKNAFYCEINPFCLQSLEYYYPNSKKYTDVTKTDFTSWLGKIDILTAGFPCQPFSIAGKRNGAEDDRYLWPHVLRSIDEIRPAWFIGENVDGITSMVLPCKAIEVGSCQDTCGECYTIYEKREQFVVERICRDLEQIGYSVQPVIIPACAVGAPHRRDRIFFIANSISDDAVRCGHGETGCKEGSCESEKEKREWVRGEFKRTCEKGIASDTARSLNARS